MAELSEREVEERLGRLDELLEQVEAIPGPSGELALTAVSVLAEVYGTALARVVALASGTAVQAAFAADPLLEHLMVLHGVHPEPVERRILRALERLGPALAEAGATAELVGVTDGVARLRVGGGGCSAAGTVQPAVREAVQAVAPELADVVLTAPSGFVPLSALGVGPVPS